MTKKLKNWIKTDVEVALDNLIEIITLYAKNQSEATEIAKCYSNHFYSKLEKSLLACGYKFDYEPMKIQKEK